MDKKGNRSLVVVMLLLVSVFALAFANAGDITQDSGEVAFTEGSGTENDPYMIYDVHDLQAMRDDLSVHYALADDIDASETSGWNGGMGFEPVGTDEEPFTGSLDGNGFVIEGLYINRPDEWYVGLFGFTGEDALVTNLGVLDAEIIGYSHVAPIVGRNQGTVRDSFATGTTMGDYQHIAGIVGSNPGLVEGSYSDVEVTSNYRWAGGIAGSNWGGTISRSYAMGSVTGYKRVGGITGAITGTVIDSYATGDVHAHRYAGGLVGINYGGTIINCYSTGRVTGGHDLGGLVGFKWGDNPTTTASFWDEQTSGLSVSPGGGIGKSTVEMMDIQTFSNAAWDIVAVDDPNEPADDHIWSIVHTETYPFLNFGHRVEEGIFKVDIIEAEVEVYKDIGIPGLQVIVTVHYTVTNTGETDTQDIDFNVIADKDESTVFTDIYPGLTLENGEVHQGTFTWTTNTVDDAGWYTAEVASQDDEDRYEVQIPSYGNLRVIHSENKEHNLVTWESTDEDVTQYYIYRAISKDGPWDETTMIEIVDADGSQEYTYIDLDRGFYDDVTWWYMVKEVGSDGLSSLDEQYPEQEPVPLTLTLSTTLESDGWNFISFNVVPVDGSIVSILADIQGSYDRLMYYDASEDRWFSYVPGRPEHFNCLQSLDRTMGVWIKMNSEAELRITGYAPKNTDITLYPGWNMVGYPSNTNRIGAEILPEEVSKVGVFNRYAPYHVEYIYDLSTLILVKGRGYWIYNDADYPVVWTVDH